MFTILPSLLSIHPAYLLPRYGNSHTRYVDRRDPVTSHSVGKKNNKSGVNNCDRSNIDAVTIHMMEIARGSAESLFDGVNAHFGVLRNGAVLHLHDESEMRVALHDFNCRSISRGSSRVTTLTIKIRRRIQEDGGAIPYENPLQADSPYDDQIAVGRALVKYLRERHRILYIFGHRQACAKVCPGPHLWYNIVKWGVDELGLSDGGVSFTTSNKFCSGAVIPADWRDAKWAIDLTGSFSAATFSGPSPIRGNVHSTIAKYPWYARSALCANHLPQSTRARPLARGVQITTKTRRIRRGYSCRAVNTDPIRSWWRSNDGDNSKMGDGRGHRFDTRRRRRGCAGRTTAGRPLPPWPTRKRPAPRWNPTA